ncbi:MAG: hypothetical protein ACXACI_12405 [Candidatus Hodarchaeales archaeon]
MGTLTKASKELGQAPPLKKGAWLVASDAPLDQPEESTMRILRYCGHDTRECFSSSPLCRGSLNRLCGVMDRVARVTSHDNIGEESPLPGTLLAPYGASVWRKKKRW